MRLTVQSLVQEEEVLNSLKALPDRITCMEEQWRDTLREVQRFNAHTDAMHDGHEIGVVGSQEGGPP